MKTKPPPEIPLFVIDRHNDYTDVTAEAEDGSKRYMLLNIPITRETPSHEALERLFAEGGGV